MRGVRSSVLGLAAVATGLVVASCLPKDTRPKPGSLDVTVTADPLLLGGGHSTSTVDGWTVSYQRFLVSLRPSFGESSSCASYSDGYTRMLDMEIAGPQKLNLLYALGHCDIGFRVGSAAPDPYLPLGRGVTQADVALMEGRGTDPYTIGRGGIIQPTGVALYAKGTATKGAVTKTFAWSFRQRVSYQECAGPRSSGDAGRGTDAAPAGGNRDAGSRDVSSTRDAASVLDAAYSWDAGPRGPQGIDLAGGEAKTVDIRMHGESLFLDSTNPAIGRLRFDIFASADDEYGNADGDITLAELGLVPLADIGLRGRYVETPLDLAIAGNVPSGSPKVPAWTKLEDFVYLGLFPKVARFEDEGTCVIKWRGR